MVEPSRLAAVKRLSNFIGTASPFAGRKGEPRLPCPPFAEILQALLHQSSLKIAQILSTEPKDRAELNNGAGLAHRRHRDEEPCRAHHEEPIEVHCPASTGYRPHTAFPPVARCTSS
jgi:hypothetical protein